MEPVEKLGVEDERKLKNVATRIMSNGVEVLVKDKGGEGKLEQVTFCFSIFFYRFFITVNENLYTSLSDGKNRFECFFCISSA